MPKFTFLRGLAAVFVLAVAGVFLWQNPGTLGARLTPDEVDRYIAAADRNLDLPAAEKADMLGRIRAWARADDGRPVYMLNLMRFYPQVRSVPGGPPASMSPAASNAHYEAKTVPMLLSIGGAAPFMGHAQGQNLLPYDARGDRWSRMLLIRYPSRRAFLQLVSDTRYPAILPYKLASLEIVLAPFTAEAMMPDYTLASAAGLLAVFLAAGWWRAERRLCAIARQLNERPRKTLLYKTPAETFAECVAAIS